MLCGEVLKNGDNKIECLGGGYIYLRNIGTDYSLIRFGGSKNWIPTFMFGEVGMILRLTEDNNLSRVKSILIKKLLKNISV